MNIGVCVCVCVATLHHVRRITISHFLARRPFNFSKDCRFQRGKKSNAFEDRRIISVWCVSMGIFFGQNSPAADCGELLKLGGILAERKRRDA